MDNDFVFLVEFNDHKHSSLDFDKIQFGPNTKKINTIICQSSDYYILKNFEYYPINDYRLSEETKDFLTELFTKMGKTNFRDSYVWDLLKTKGVIFLTENPTFKYEIRDDHIFFGLYNISKDDSENHNKMFYTIRSLIEEKVLLPYIANLDVFTSHTLKFAKDLDTLINQLANQGKCDYNTIFEQFKSRYPDVENPSTTDFAETIVKRFIKEGCCGDNYMHKIDKDKIDNHDYSEYAKYCKDILGMNIG